MNISRIDKSKLFSSTKKNTNASNISIQQQHNEKKKERKIILECLKLTQSEGAQSSLSLRPSCINSRETRNRRSPNRRAQMRRLRQGLQVQISSEAA